VSILCVSVLPEEELLKFRFKEVTLGYLTFNTSLYYLIVVMCS
jgi:hypothetical protein